MAKRRGSPAGPQNRGDRGGESSTPLIFFLVFSVLLNLCLGVATYFGFQRDSKLAGENDEFKKQVELYKDNAEWYKFQALSYRAYMGQIRGEDIVVLNELRGKFDLNKLGPKSNATDKQELPNFIRTVLEQGRHLSITDPKQNYESLLEAKSAKTAELTTQLNKMRQDKAKADTQVTSSKNELSQETTKADEELKKLRAEFQAKLDDYFTVVQKAKEDLEKSTNQSAATLLALDTEKHKVEQQLQIANAKIEGQKQQMAKKDIRIATLEKQMGTDIPAEVRLDWRIVNIDKNGTTAYINLGSADKVTSGLTFRVHGIGEDGKAKPKDKAAVEVLNVVNDHLSQVRVLYDYDERLEGKAQRHDPRHNPVLKGDVLYNPTWDPNQKKHIAIAGAVDLIGDGHDSLPEFIRSMERQNIIVDAYVDNKDFTIKGPGITVNTDLLVVAPLPKTLSDARGADLDVKNKMVEAVRTMKKQAEDNGVKRRGLRQWLEEIGYRIPKGLADDAADYNYGGSKANNAEPAAPPVKPDNPPVKPENPPK